MTDIQLIATDPKQLEVAQKELVNQLVAQERRYIEEAVELKENLEIAEKNNWHTSALKRQYKRAMDTALYYQKLKMAAKEGYYIVPNMPLDIFAIRTNKSKPLRKQNQWDKSQKAQLLPQGNGSYVDNAPFEKTYVIGSGENKETVSYASEFDAVQFPVNLVKPQVMDATAAAMNLKLFDQIGIAPQTRNGDPMIIGQILKPHTSDWNNYGGKQAVSFLIAWFLDTDDL